MHIILASASPRRKELLTSMGLTFTIKIPDIHEKLEPDEPPEVFCTRLSYDKAMTIGRDYPDAIVIGADTVVVIDGHILGKPCNTAEARDFLQLLRSREHEVFTGYTVLHHGQSRSVTRVVRTSVTFRAMSEAEISWYIATAEPMDKAGAYALQGLGAIFVERIDGSHTNVIGLPVSELYQDLKSFGIRPAVNQGGPLWETA